MEHPRRLVPTGSPLPGADGLLLTDQTVELGPLAVADAEEHFAGQDHEWRRWLGAGPESAEGTVNWLCRCEECWRSGGPVFAFGVRAAGRDGLLGTVELRVGEDALLPGRASIRCGLYPRARGRGVARRACRLAACFALHALAGDPWNVTEVVAQIDACNIASLRMIKHAGFVHADSCVAAGEAWELFAIGQPQLAAAPGLPPARALRRTA